MGNKWNREEAEGIQFVKHLWAPAMRAFPKAEAPSPLLDVF